MRWRKQSSAALQGNIYSEAHVHPQSDLQHPAGNTYTNSFSSNGYSNAPSVGNSHSACYADAYSAAHAVGLSNCDSVANSNLFDIHHDRQFERGPLRTYLDHSDRRQGADSGRLRQWIDGFGIGRTLRRGRRRIDIDWKHDYCAGRSHRDYAEQR